MGIFAAPGRFAVFKTILQKTGTHSHMRKKGSIDSNSSKYSYLSHADRDFRTKYGTGIKETCDYSDEHDKSAGGFFPRQDVIMTAVWFFALFALLHTGVFQGTLILKELCHEKKTNYSMWVVLVLVFLTADSFMENGFMENIFEAYQRWIVLPGMFGILLFVPLVCRIRNCRKGGKSHVKIQERNHGGSGFQLFVRLCFQ